MTSRRHNGKAGRRRERIVTRSETNPDYERSPGFVCLLAALLSN